jgi:hypothetical protein
MRIIFGSLFLLALTTNAFAYEEGTYSCKNAEGLPNNTYKIENVTVGSASLPYVEINRYYRNAEGAPPRHSSLRGLAAISTSGEGENAIEILSVASLRLEFKNGQLFNCRQ